MPTQAEENAMQADVTKRGISLGTASASHQDG